MIGYTVQGQGSPTDHTAHAHLRARKQKRLQVCALDGQVKQCLQIRFAILRNITTVATSTGILIHFM